MSGSSAFERGTAQAPHRMTVVPRDDDDGIREIEEAIRDDARLSDAFARLTSRGWRVSRLALSHPFVVDASRKTMVIDAHFESWATLARWVEQAVRRAYLTDNDLRRTAIRDLVLMLFTQQAADPRRLTDLEIMAQTYEWAAWYFELPAPGAYYWIPDLMSDLTRVLSGERSRGRWQDMRERGFAPDRAYFVGPDQFASSGFKRAYRDKSNQVSHATASMMVNIVHGTYLGYWAAQARENQDEAFADVRLNDKCRELVSMMENLPRVTGIGELIRTELGDPSETGRWVGPSGGLRDP